MTAKNGIKIINTFEPFLQNKYNKYFDHISLGMTNDNNYFFPVTNMHYSF